MRPEAMVSDVITPPCSALLRVRGSQPPREEKGLKGSHRARLWGLRATPKLPPAREGLSPAPGWRRRSWGQRSVWPHQVSPVGVWTFVNWTRKYEQSFT